MSEPEPCIQVEVLLFARARELAGGSSLRLEVPQGATVADAARRLMEARVALAQLLPSCRFAVNDEFAASSDPLPPGAVLAVIPPVSGG